MTKEKSHDLKKYLLSRVISVRFNNSDLEKLNLIYKKYKGERKSKILRNLILSDRKPVISSKESELLMTLIVLLDELQLDLSCYMDLEDLEGITKIQTRYEKILQTLYERLTGEKR